MSTPNRQGLSAAKQALLERRLAARAPAGGVAEQAIPRAPRDAMPRASFAQERMWFLDRLVPGSAAYNVFAPIRLRGPLDDDALVAAVHAVVARHNVLQTRFDTRTGMPLQAVDVPVPTVERIDLRDARDRVAAARAAVAERTVLPFDLEHGPLLRVTLALLDDDDRVLLVVAHHTVFDAISIDRFLRDLDSAYRADGRLPEPSIQYADYAHWQRRRLDSAVGAEQLEYWRARLTPTPAALDLPLDRPRTPLVSPRGGTVWWTAPRELSPALRAFCAAERVTPFAVGLATFAALLGRAARQDDVVVGTPHSGRVRPELEELVGCFINTLVLRLDVSDRPSFGELVRRARATVVEATEHAEVPFEWLVQELQPERNLARPPLVQVIFNYQHARGVASIGDARVVDFFVPPASSRLDVEVSLLEGADGFEAFWNFNADLFEQRTIEAWSESFGRLLAAGVADPDAPVLRLPLLGPEETRRILHDWNPPPTAPASRTVHAAFAETAAVHAHADAVVCGDASATYAELDALARGVAGQLRAHGLSAEDRVGIFVRPSIGLVQAIVGTFQAGCAYVPLDPALPPERLEWILQDAAPAAIVTERSLLGALPAEGPPVVLVEDIRPTPAGAVADGTGDQLAYVLYTSGSTGRPKGVLIEHRSVVSFIRSTQRLFDVTADDRVIAFASIGFDVSVFEMFSALLNGARLVVASEDERRSPELLQTLLERHGITIVDLPPAVMELLVPERLQNLRIAFVGGEAFTGAMTTRWASAGCRFFNGYGPTESTVTVVAKECLGAYGSSPPIGRAMENHRAYVLDDWMQPVPVGVPGELYIGGVGLARGYLGRPDLTAERFVPDPLSGIAGSRLYRTGDLVKWNGDGDLVFLGRADRQLKIRGIRIEPQEVEETLQRHPAVAAVAVEPWHTPTGMRLAAYVVPDPAAASDTGTLADDLTKHARRSLVEAMVPGAIVLLDELPLTRSGKVDRAALPEPAAARRRHVPPSTPAEHALADVLADLLQADQVGMTDSFFELGGHSLLGMQVVRRLRERFDVDVPVSALFTSPTIRALAQVVDELQRSGGPDASPLVCLRSGDEPPIVLVHPTGGGLFCYGEIVEALPPDRAVFGFEQTEPGPRRLSELAASYLDVLAMAGIERPAAVAGWSFGGVVAYELATLMYERSGVAPEVVLVDSYLSRDQLGWERASELAHVFVADILAMTGADVPEPRNTGGGDDAFLAAALAGAHARGALLELDADELRRRYAIFRANAIALAEYVAAPYPGRVTFVKAAESVSTAGVWQPLSADLDVHVADGDHHSLVRGPSAETVAAILESVALRATSVRAGR